jgi:hypothetical protein
MSQTTLQLTAEELEVLQALVEFHVGCEIPDWLNVEAYDSVVDKVLGV